MAEVRLWQPGHAVVVRRRLLLADTVAKVENRTTLKISRRLIFGLACRCPAIQCRYEGPWSILDVSIWSLTSPRVKRISGSRKFRSSPQKDFFNSIGHEPTFHDKNVRHHAASSSSRAFACFRSNVSKPSVNQP